MYIYIYIYHTYTTITTTTITPATTQSDLVTCRWGSYRENGGRAMEDHNCAWVFLVRFGVSIFEDFHRLPRLHRFSDYVSRIVHFGAVI